MIKICKVLFKDLKIGMRCRCPADEDEYSQARYKYDGMITNLIEPDKITINWNVLKSGESSNIGSAHYNHLYITDIALYEDELKLYTEVIKSNKPQTIYPNKCQFCKAPSRKAGNLIICSNHKCRKSHRALNQFTKSYKSLPVSFNDNFIRCPECNDIARNFDRKFIEVGTMMCPNNHRWEHRFSIGEKIIYLSVLGLQTTLTYDGAFFI